MSIAIADTVGESALSGTRIAIPAFLIEFSSASVDIVKRTHARISDLFSLTSFLPAAHRLSSLFSPLSRILLTYTSLATIPISGVVAGYVGYLKGEDMRRILKDGALAAGDKGFAGFAEGFAGITDKHLYTFERSLNFVDSATSLASTTATGAALALSFLAPVYAEAALETAAISSLINLGVTTTKFAAHEAGYIDNGGVMAGLKDIAVHFKNSRKANRRPDLRVQI